MGCWNMNRRKKRIPVSGTFELTGRCNLSCRMCLVRVNHEKMRQLGRREKTSEEWIHMARQARDAGTLGLLLTGGEAMIRADFCEIYEAAAQMGFLLTVYTNAAMITDRVMRSFRKFPPHQIGVTMYGASNRTYEKLCGCPDGYDRFCEGIQKLRALPSLLEMRTTIVKENQEDLEAMKKFTREHFGEDRKLQISRFVTKGIRGSVTDPSQCRLTPEENVRMIYSGMAQLHRKVKAGEIELPKSEQKLPRNKIRQTEGHYLFENCSAGINQYAISWDGRMFGCELMTEGYTEPFRDGFQKAWEKLPEQYPKSQKIKACTECSFGDFCETCPAVRMAETGDWFGVPKYFCKEARYIDQMASDLGVIDKDRKQEEDRDGKDDI